MSRKRKQPIPGETSDEEDDQSVEYSKRPATEMSNPSTSNVSDVLTGAHQVLHTVEDSPLSGILLPLDIFSDSGTESDLLLDHTTATDPEVDTDQFADPSGLGQDYPRQSGDLLSMAMDMVGLSLPDMGGTLNNWECEICNKVYSDKYLLETHKQNVHNFQTQGITCPHCGKIYKTSTELKIHIQKKHPVTMGGMRKGTGAQTLGVGSQPETGPQKGAGVQTLGISPQPSRLLNILNTEPAIISQPSPTNLSALVPATSVAPVSSASMTSASGPSLISVSQSTAASPDKSILGRKHSECTKRAFGTTPKPLLGEPSGPTSRDSSEPPSAGPSRSGSATSVTSSSDADYSARVARFKCTKCDDMSFYNNYHLELHMKKFHGVEPTTLITCEICGGYYADQIQLRKHMKREHPEAVRSRLVSATSVPSSSDADYSARLGRFKCTKCDDMSFFNNYYLELHMKKFHGVEPTTLKTCEICGKPYANQNKLRAHMQKEHPEVSWTVTRPASWKCEICNKVLACKQNLEKHKQKVHNFQKPGIPCPHCGKIVEESVGLNVHIARKHPGMAGVNHLF